jgi:hypothetical protein
LVPFLIKPSVGLVRALVELAPKEDGLGEGDDLLLEEFPGGPLR